MRRALRPLIAIALVSAATAHAKPPPRPDPCADDPNAPGAADPFRAPTDKATELNAAGKVPYRQGKWDEARALYKAALAADPEFLAPHLNIACSFVRQERWEEALWEVNWLLSKAHVPWAREVLEAADLGALKARPEMKQIRASLEGSATIWGNGLDEALVLVARMRSPLKVPDGPGVFVLNPHQEAFAYLPQAHRFRQLTAENGHVVAVAHQGKRIAYVTAEKLVRGDKPADVTLRGVTLHVLNLSTMTPEASGTVAGDVKLVRLFWHGPEFKFWISGERANGLYHFERGTLMPAGMPRALPPPLAILTPGGAEPIRERRTAGRCARVAREVRAPGAPPAISVGPPRGPYEPIPSGKGAGFAGLPIP